MSEKRTKVKSSMIFQTKRNLEIIVEELSFGMTADNDKMTELIIQMLLFLGLLIKPEDKEKKDEQYAELNGGPGRLFVDLRDDDKIIPQVGDWQIFTIDNYSTVCPWCFKRQSGNDGPPKPGEVFKCKNCELEYTTENIEGKYLTGVELAYYNGTAWIEQETELEVE